MTDTLERMAVAAVKVEDVLHSEPEARRRLAGQKAAAQVLLRDMMESIKDDPNIVYEARAHRTEVRHHIKNFAKSLNINLEENTDAQSS